MKKKINLKKINTKEKRTVKRFACHCGCEGNPFSALGDGYMGKYL